MQRNPLGFDAEQVRKRSIPAVSSTGANQAPQDTIGGKDSALGHESPNLKGGGAPMLKLLSCAALSLLALSLACSGSSPPPAPTPTSSQASTSAPSPAPAEDVLSPLSITDSAAFLSEVSSAEQTCISENIDPDRLISLLAAPDLATDEDAVSLIGCLEGETLLRFFLSAILTATGPLSAESSGCVRDVFTDVDLAAPMIASVGDPEAGAGLMAGFFSTLVCLNEAEFQTAGPALELGNIDQQGVQCLLDELGGAEGLAALMDPAAGPPLALFAAALTCNLELTADPVAAP